MVQGLRVDYVHAAGAAAKEKPVVEGVARQATDAREEQPLRVHITRGQIAQSEVGLVNKETVPGYRIFVDQLDMQMQDLSNTFDRGIARVSLEGRFMGNGKLTTRAVIRPQNPLPDFDQSIKILKTKPTSLNNVLRAHADADVQAGTFTFFSQMTVQKGKVAGYVRPFFKDVDVYDPEQDKDKGFMNQV